MKPKRWDKNRSPVGWYLATYLERFAFEGEDESNPRRRCRAWENTVLIRASTPEQAYRRTLKHAKAGADTPWTDFSDAPGRLIFEGFTSLLPIYEALEDGAELLWRDHGKIAIGTVRRMVKAREELQVFQEPRATVADIE